MKNIIKYLMLIAPMALSLILGCSKDNPASNGETTMPEIKSLTAEKTKILYGGQDPAIITCQATGGSLKYVWEVDLGDIIPINSDRSQVSFSGAACCVGDKIIKCTVSNDKGSVSKTITITILETITVPEIISIQSDKTEIHAGTGEKADIVCNAIGGNLKYKWEADCGELAIQGSDSSKVFFSASEACIGGRNIKCTVSNDKGTVRDSMQITVLAK